MDINIAYGTDEQYTRYAYLSIFSLLNHSSVNDKITVYFFTLKGNKYIPRIKNLEKYFLNFQLKTIYLEKENYRQLKTAGSYINFSTFFRFAIDQLEGIEKIIYIDADTIINSNIKELFDENLDGNIVGVCSDIPTKYTKDMIKELSLKTQKYFNAGILLIDLQKRKSFQVSQKCINLLSKKVYKFNDQDALNIVLENHCKRLPGKYNVSTGYFYFIWGIDKFCNIGFDKSYYLEAIKNPKIIHYTGQQKPRNLINEHPFRKVYDSNIMYEIKTMKLKQGNIKELFIILIHYLEDKAIEQETRRKFINKFINNKK